MTEHDHLKNLVNLGFIVDEKARGKIENLNEEDFLKLIEGVKKDNVFIIDELVLRKVLTEEVKMLRTLKRMDVFTVQDFVKSLNEKYSFLQDILIKKLGASNIVSINKCSDGSATLIGMVKEKEDGVLSLEDSTGEIRVTMPKVLGERISADDVIAVSGMISNKTFAADKVVFPDISLKPVVYSGEPVKVAFSSKKSKSDYQVTKSKVKDNLKGKEYDISPPCIFKIGNVVFLMLLESDPLDVLRKRYVRAGNSDFLIEPSPDIVLTDMDVNTNYKGISIVSKDKVIDLKTREVQAI